MSVERNEEYANLDEILEMSLNLFTKKWILILGKTSKII